MADVVNLWPDPKFVSSDTTTVLGINYLPNPSPVSSLSGWTATGTASVTLDAGASIKGAGGVEVTSPDAASGLRIAGVEQLDGGPAWRVNFSVYVRAHAAMTLTATVTSDMALGVSEIGWGDYGWGETFTYAESASYTFAAGEVKRLRMAVRTTASTAGTRNWGFHLKGAGTFDADAGWLTYYVVDGVDPTYYPGGNSSIPGVMPYFDGNTTDTAEFSYSWEGTPEASRSIKRGNKPKYASTREGGGFGIVGHNNARTAILPGGEKGLALQSGWGQMTADSVYFGGYGADFKTSLGLEVGKKYVMSLDVVSHYENFIEGYPGDPAWDTFYFVRRFTPSDQTPEAGTPLPTTLRRRLHLPIIPSATTAAEAYVSCYRNWMTGESFITDASIFEVEFAATTWTPNGNAALLPLDLLAHGLQPGKNYTANLSGGLTAAGQFYRIEYQTAAGGSTWTTLAEDLHDPAKDYNYHRYQFTVPAAATALRLSAASTQVYFNLDVFSTPPAGFDGDTPDGGGYTYAWSGTPYQSSSIRSEAAAGSVTAQLHTGGTAKTVSEMRIVSGGSLVPITEAG